MLCVVKDRRKDPDNLLSGAIKCLLDGLVKAGVLPNDGQRQIRGIGGYVWVRAPDPGTLCVHGPRLLSFVEIVDALGIPF